MAKPKKRRLLVFVCNYSVSCNGKCEKCRWLKEAEIVDLADLKAPADSERCECG